MKPLLLTMGDAAGIGPDIIAKAWGLGPAVVVGSATVIRRAQQQCGIERPLVVLDAPDEAAPPEGKDGDGKPPEGAVEVKEGESEGPPPRQGFGKPFKKKAAEAPAEEAAQGNATGESKAGASLKDLVNDGFVIRTTVFIPAEAVTRQLGKVSGDAVVVKFRK